MRLLILIIPALLICLVLFFLINMVLNFRKPAPGEALVRTGLGGNKVALNRGISVMPLFHQLSVVDLSSKRVIIEKEGRAGLVCQDGQKANVRMEFFIGIEQDEDGILQAIKTVGHPDETFNNTKIQELFSIRLKEILELTAKSFTVREIIDKRDVFKTALQDEARNLLGGYAIEHIAIDYIST